jgi:hypothetical protein
MMLIAFALFNAFVAMTCLATAAPYLQSGAYGFAAISLILAAGNAATVSFWLRHEP